MSCKRAVACFMVKKFAFVQLTFLSKTETLDEVFNIAKPFICPSHTCHYITRGLPNLLRLGFLLRRRVAF